MERHGRRILGVDGVDGSDVRTLPDVTPTVMRGISIFLGIDPRWMLTPLASRSVEDRRPVLNENNCITDNRFSKCKKLAELELVPLIPSGTPGGRGLESMICLKREEIITQLFIGRLS